MLVVCVGIGMEEVAIIERSAASCESMCSVGCIGSNGSRKEGLAVVASLDACAAADGVDTDVDEVSGV